MFKKILDFVSKLTGKKETEVKKEERKGFEKRDPEVKPKEASKPNRDRSRENRGRETQGKRKVHSDAGTDQKPRWRQTDYVVEPEEGKTRFHDLGLPDRIMHAIADLDFKYCTPVQAEVLVKTLKGQDATGQAQTGTGKTAAFLITILNYLLRNPIRDKRPPGTPRALILAPTRELVIQIAADAEKLAKYLRVGIQAVYGGMDYKKQKRNLQRRVDIVVATPGRLLDFHGQHDIHLSKIEILVLDEADRMLDMGFYPDMKKIERRTPPKAKRQTLLFSATIPDEVKRISSNWTKDPVNVEIEPEQIAVKTVEQVVYITTTDEKFDLLFNIVRKEDVSKAIIFVNRRTEAKRLSAKISTMGYACKELSGDVDQKKRLRTLKEFKEGKLQMIVATDVAGRGIHIDGISHVFNFNLPSDPEDYVHRIGRTGRAGHEGKSISFACEDDGFYIPAIEEFIGCSLHVEYPDESLLKPFEAPEQKNSEGDKKPEQKNVKENSKPRNKRDAGNRRNKTQEQQGKKKPPRQRTERKTKTEISVVPKTATETKDSNPVNLPVSLRISGRGPIQNKIRVRGANVQQKMSLKRR